MTLPQVQSKNKRNDKNENDIEENKKSTMLADLRDKFYWRAVLAEGFATMLFIMNVVLVVTLSAEFGSQKIVVISLAIGMSVSILVHIFGPISGAHMNPAVTIAVFALGEINLLKAVMYIIAQLIGGILASAIAYGLVPCSRHGNLATMQPSEGMTLTQAFFTEMLMTMLLDYTVFASVLKDNGRKNFGFLTALAIGWSVVVAHLVGIPLTGTGINPARAFGPSVVTGNFHSSHWVYWLGPMVGGLICGLTYRFIFSAEPQKASGQPTEIQLKYIENEKV